MDWFNQILKAKKSTIIDKNLKKVHYDFGNGKEMVEEYNLETSVVTRRAWRDTSKLGEQDKWDIEVGDPEPNYNNDNNAMIKENSNQPFVTRRITKLNLEWRIRNLPYPIETYSVTVDPNENCMVVRTSNKKYFKKLPVPDLTRLNLQLNQENISFSHKFNTLIITYKKPKELIDFEKAVFEEVKKVQPRNHGDTCNPS